MRRLPSILYILCCIFYSSFLFSQKIIEGRVLDSESKKPLSGVQVLIKNSTKSVNSDENGYYKIIVPEKAKALIFTFLGFAKMEVEIQGTERIDIGMRSYNSRDIENIITIGSRNQNRTKLESPVSVDVIPSEQLVLQGSNVSLSQILNTITPAFNANIQSGADASDHVEPFSLRGLAPDQTLVLINGKRYHPSSLFNIYGSLGRGSVSTDLNSIPVSLIDHVEILKDGAAAQYGSDAIGGIINIVLKTDMKGGNIGVQLGENITGYGSTLNYPGFGKVLKPTTDGESFNVNATYGLKFKKGFLIFAGEIFKKNHLYRPNNDSLFPETNYRVFSNGKSSNYNTSFTGKYKLNKGELYAFGGFNFRNTDSYLWTISPEQGDRFVPEIYNTAFDPKLNTTNYDVTTTIGFKTKLRDWNIDFSNTAGYNHIDYRIFNTLNASLLKYSPTSFFGGELFFYQNSINLDINKRYDKILNGLNIGLGAETRFEKYTINAGEEASWKNYSPIIKLNIDGSKDTIYKMGGAQGYPGYKPQDVINPNRRNVGLYADTELDISRNFLIATAMRFENYTDFGTTLGLKIASRWRLAPTFLLRGSLQTSFRAPSLAQLYFNKTALDISIEGENFEKILAANNSELAQKVGIPPLRAEKSYGGNFEASYYPTTGVHFSVNLYSINVNGRIILTGRFDNKDASIGDDLNKLQLRYAQFNSNALNTRTRGLDITSNYIAILDKHKFNFTVKANINKMKVTGYNIPEKLIGKENSFISEFETQYLLSNGLNNKIIAQLNYNYKKWGLSVGVTRYSRVSYYNYSAIPGYDTEADALKSAGKTDEWLDLVSNKYAPRTISDISLSCILKKNLTFRIGANNIFDVYPSIQDPSTTESGGMWEATQMGFGGAYFYTNLNFKF